MADMGRLISEADAYGDERFDEGKRSRQGEVDGLQQQVAASAQLLDEAHTSLGRLDAQLEDLQARYDAHMATHVAAPAPTRIGMSSGSASLWPQRLAEVGAAGITARRIFSDDVANPGQRDGQIRDAIAAGMLPVLSYKGVPTVANVAALRTYLTSLPGPVTVTYFHEPRGDLAPDVFRARSKVFAAVAAPTVRVGPILNGWLLDTPARRDEFASFMNAELLDAWDFVGVDTYETLGMVPGDRIPLLVDLLESTGHGDMPIVVGEYNGKSGGSIAQSGETFLSTPQVEVACVWNATGTGSAEATPLEGARLAAFKATKADPRALK